MIEFAEALKNLIFLKHPVCVVQTWEEERFVRILSEMLRNVKIHRWTASRGLVMEDQPVEGTRDPAEAVRYLSSRDAPSAAVFHDADSFFSDHHSAFLRGVKEYSLEKRGQNHFIFFTSSYFIVPELLKRDVQTLILPPPSDSEILEMTGRFFSESSIQADEELLERSTAILKGLTEREIEFALKRVKLRVHDADRDALLDALMEEKTQLVRAGGVIEPVPVAMGVEQIGGLNNLKEWLKVRERFVRSYLKGISTILPRGVLLMGISGCGKSLSVKAVSDIWKLPLFKMDMNLVFSESYGPAEKVFHEALRFMESVAPAILWLDEIEMGLSAQADTSTSARVFAHFLTWMQERKELVFVAATANRIDLLPAEMIRRGRFDQVFFVDLPSEEERKSIFQVHLKRLDQDISKFDFMTLAQATKEFSGAEIEQIVVSALAAAISDGRELTQDDIYWEVHHIIPLATTMQEQIKSIRSWARKRAVNASKQP